MGWRSGVLGYPPPSMPLLTFSRSDFHHPLHSYSLVIYFSPWLSFRLSFHILTVPWLAQNANGLARHSFLYNFFPLWFVCVLLEPLLIYFLVEQWFSFFLLPPTAPMPHYYPVISPLFRCVRGRRFVKLLLFSHIINKSSIAAHLHPEAPGPRSKAGEDVEGRMQHHS